MTSRNQKDIEEITQTKAKIKQYLALLKACIAKTPDVVNDNKEIQVNKGQTDGETKWKG
jgi:hypothetical protein